MGSVLRFLYSDFSYINFYPPPRRGSCLCGRRVAGEMAACEELRRNWNKRQGYFDAASPPHEDAVSALIYAILSSVSAAKYEKVLKRYGCKLATMIWEMQLQMARWLTNSWLLRCIYSYGYTKITVQGVKTVCGAPLQRINLRPPNKSARKKKVAV